MGSFGLTRGLATVYGIVQQSGGFIGVQSEVGRGTTFDIHLPRATASETAPEGVVEGRAQHVRGSGTILLAEDQSALRAVARRALERVGYRVLEAANGEEALRVARAEEGPIDLLLTDVVMPLMSGTDLAEKIVAERPGTRVLLMSGYAAEGMLENASGAGRDLIHKPFSPSDLLARVGEVLQSAPAEPS